MISSTHPAPARLAFVLGACLTLLAAVAQPAQAARPARHATESLHVSLAGVNLDSPDGQQEARRRLARAASRLCHELVDTRRFEAQQLMLACMGDALAPAIAELERATQARSAERFGESGTASAGR